MAEFNRHHFDRGFGTRRSGSLTGRSPAHSPRYTGEHSLLRLSSDPESHGAIRWRCERSNGQTARSVSAGVRRRNFPSGPTYACVRWCTRPTWPYRSMYRPPAHRIRVLLSRDWFRIQTFEYHVELLDRYAKDRLWSRSCRLRHLHHFTNK